MVTDGNRPSDNTNYGRPSDNENIIVTEEQIGPSVTTRILLLTESDHQTTRIL